jgi:hypothetical protein
MPKKTKRGKETAKLIMSNSVASSHMKKWGIPESIDKNKAPEISLLERLVWVRYQSHWWPALLYHSYTELQHHLYDQLDMVLKAQFAMAIMRHMQERRRVKVARLLGRPILEVIEVEKDCFTEFYWQLPHVLPKACQKSEYGKDVELYYDFHRALDQVEDIIRDVSQENFALMPSMDQQSWLERSHKMDNTMHGDEQSFTRNRSFESKSTITCNTEQSPNDEVSRNSYSNPFLAENQNIPEASSATHTDRKRSASRTSSRSHTLSPSASLRMAAEDRGPAKIIPEGPSYRDGKRHASKTSSSRSSRTSASLPIIAGGNMAAMRRSLLSDDTSGSSKASRMSSRSHKTRGGVSQAGTEVAGNLSSKPVEMTENLSSKPVDETRDPPAEHSKSGKVKAPTKSNTPETAPSGIELAIEGNEPELATAPAPAPAPTPTPTPTPTPASSGIADRGAVPSSKISTNEKADKTDKEGSSETSSGIADRGAVPSSKNSRNEKADKTDREESLDTREGDMSTALVLSDPYQVLPGLEGDDIVPGLSVKVNHARGIWTDVWETLLLNKRQQAPEEATKSTIDNSAKKGFVQALAAQGTVAEEADEVVRMALENLTFWERMTCASP